jgi:hypothetical protein
MTLCPARLISLKAFRSRVRAVEETAGPFAICPSFRSLCGLCVPIGPSGWPSGSERPPDVCRCPSKSGVNCWVWLPEWLPARDLDPRIRRSIQKVRMVHHGSVRRVIVRDDLGGRTDYRSRCCQLVDHVDPLPRLPASGLVATSEGQGAGSYPYPSEKRPSAR